MLKETKQGKAMVRAGFPYCFAEGGYERHCKACIEMYKKRLTTVNPKK